uniref:PUA domain-containing protein n=1 Tax=Geoglobus ahangari TaxID=113653 RepID=A0A7C3UI95_9EURY
MEVRELKKKELKILKNALRFFRSEDILEKYKVFVVERDKKEVYVATEEIFSLNSKLNFKHLGIKIGEIGKRLRLTLEGAYFVVKNRKRVFVNETGEMLFLYGRDIFASSVIKTDRDVKENDIVFVCNKDGDILGIGRSRYDATQIKEVEKDRVVVENLVDRGEYIRGNRTYNAY